RDARRSLPPALSRRLGGDDRRPRPARVRPDDDALSVDYHRADGFFAALEEALPPLAARSRCRSAGSARGYRGRCYSAAAAVAAGGRLFHVVGSSAAPHQPRRSPTCSGPTSSATTMWSSGLWPTIAC